MFSFDGVKIEEDPFNSLLNPDCTINHCITSFYDQDSNEDIIQAKCSTSEVICYLEHTLDLIDTPLNDVMRKVIENPLFKGVDLHLLRKKILREKNRLKRQRAKNRNAVIHERRVAAFVPMVEQQDQQYKKQRNRISAQISRDRKKEKVKALEELARQLQEECKQQKEQNEKLKRQAKQRALQQETLKSPFTRMLVFLGIIFLFTIIKDILGVSETTKTIAKIQESTKGLLSSGKEIASTPFFEHKEPMEQLEKALTESVEDKGVVTRLKQGIQERVTGWMNDRRLSELLRTAVSRPKSWQNIG